MRKSTFMIIFIHLFLTSFSYAGIFDEIKKGIGIATKGEPDKNMVISGLKEALSIGTNNAVDLVSKVNGYLGNPSIKILMPEKIQKIADVLGKAGYQKEVDDFILTMNRAAEKAAPRATSFFVNAIKEMTFEDARTILHGGDTAATDYFKKKTHHKIYDAFNPVISSTMNEVGVTRSYKKMMDKYRSLPFMKAESLDLDNYVTNKALDGLFFMIGQEEKKIRTDPAARVTDLLKKVFEKK